MTNGGPERSERPARKSATATKAAAPDAGNGTWTLDTGYGTMTPRSALDVLADVRQKVATGELADYEPIPLGMAPLERMLGGGIRPGELMLIGGAQGTGKTTMALQMARNVAASGQAIVLYVNFEHDDADMLNRLIAMESVLPHLPNTKPSTGAIKITDVRAEVIRSWARLGEEQLDLSTNPRLRPAIERIARYGTNLYLLRGSATASTIENLRDLIRQHRAQAGEQRMLLIVDYLQKVPQIPEPPTESEKVTYVVQGLKDIALAEKIPTIAIVAADKEGLKAARLRNHHLRGSSAINYEADIILILNEKYQIVAKVNIEFNPYQAQRFRDWVIVSVEKNRSGADNVDTEFHKHFEFSCFDPTGRPVQEKLIEERLYND
ncbi:MAG TPA: DnaB-like helicase C-terminal domain-containing protein [Candidatus Limnocylindrales bacterium]|nr:DnaB-like helicase C-terminal domain-containing protein [Candidatus Limnocylindrales bacterium]